MEKNSKCLLSYCLTPAGASWHAYIERCSRLAPIVQGTKTTPYRYDTLHASLRPPVATFSVGRDWALSWAMTGLVNQRCLSDQMIINKNLNGPACRAFWGGRRTGSSHTAVLKTLSLFQTHVEARLFNQFILGVTRGKPEAAAKWAQRPSVRMRKKR